MQGRIRRVLIANRGEVVVRISTALRELGISPVIIFTEPDRGAVFTRAGDVAVCVGGAAGYLDVAAVVAAARETGADAIHPGYGFLSENAQFAAAVAAAGIIFIGPNAETIRALGSKIGAKSIIAAKAPHVPLIPGFYEQQQASPQTKLGLEEWRAKALEIGFPLLIKAAAGGGGKGMRVVRRVEDFQAALESVRVEARGAFGDETFLLERYFQNVRHIEVQVMGDTHGDACHLFERECSVQRRHQKLIEECPSPALSRELREEICGAAVAVARCVGYSNAGTVEFIFEEGGGEEERGAAVAKKGKYYFLEVNTRLQVEHGVTELCTNVDIVKTQLLIASGARLRDALQAARINPALPPLPPQPDGHAIEVRVYAEDDSFAPCIGAISGFELPPHARYHCATAVGSVIGVSYDGLIAKVLVHAESREASIRKLVAALKGLIVFGVRTNRRALVNLLMHDRVASGRMATDLIDRGIIATSALTRDLPGAVSDATGLTPLVRSLAAATVASMQRGVRASGGAAGAVRGGPWGRVPASWSNSGPAAPPRPKRFVAWEGGGGSIFCVTIKLQGVGSADGERHTLSIQEQPGAKGSAGGDVDGASARPIVDITLEAELRPLQRQHDAHGAAVGGVHRFHLLVAKPGAQRVSAGEVVALQRVDSAADAASAWAAAAGCTAVGTEYFVQFADCGNLVHLGQLDPLGGPLTPATTNANQGDLLPASYATAAAATIPGQATRAEAQPTASSTATAASGASGSTPVRAPIPAKIVKVSVKSGANVRRGEVVVVLESMKMETKLTAPCNGTARVLATVGSTVAAGTVVFVVTPAAA